MSAARRESRAVVFSQRVYRLLLAAYPRAHRQEYGGPMTQLFRDQCRDAWKRRRFWGVIWLWLRVLPDLLKTAIWERLTNRGERKFMFRKTSAGFRDKWGLLGKFVGVYAVVFVLCVMAATIVAFIVPATYTSRARIKVEWETGSEQRLTGMYDLNTIQTELQTIQSEKILDEVIYQLDLNSVWASKNNPSQKLKFSESRDLLKRMIEVRPARNTSLIDITVFSRNAPEAARIANAIANTYQTYRLKQRETLLTASENEFKKLKDELKNELADKANDPKAVDDKITQTIARAGQVWNGKLHEAAFAGTLTQTVEIIENAQPGFRPVRPNKRLNIAVGIVVGGLAGFLVAMGVVVVGLMRRDLQAAKPAQSPA